MTHFAKRFFGQGIVKDGLQLYLDASNTSSYPGSGTTWYDLSGNGNNGTLQNGVSYNAANGGLMSFDGIDDFVSLNDNTVFIYNNQPFTISLWFYYVGYPYPYQYSDILFIKTNTGNSFQIGSTTNTSSYGSIAFGAYGSWVRKHTGTGYLALLNTWTHFTVTYNGNGSTNANNFNAYVNGVLKSKFEQSGYALTQNINRIGYNYNNGKFSGKLPHLLYYNRELSQAEALQSFNATKSKYGL